MIRTGDSELVGEWPCPFCGHQRQLADTHSVRVRNRNGGRFERLVLVRRLPGQRVVNAPQGPLMVHVTDLTGAGGLGLVNCGRCGSAADASTARVGTIVDGDVSSSVLLCVDCGDDPEIRPWLIDKLTEGADQSERRSYAGVGSAAQKQADRAKDLLDAAKARAEVARKFARSADERVRRRRYEPASEPGEEDDPA